MLYARNHKTQYKQHFRAENEVSPKFNIENLLVATQILWKNSNTEGRILISVFGNEGVEAVLQFFLLNHCIHFTGKRFFH